MQNSVASQGKKVVGLLSFFFFLFAFKVELKLYILWRFRWTGIITSLNLLYQIYASIRLESDSYRNLPAISCSKNKSTAWRCSYSNCMEVSSSTYWCFRLWLFVQPTVPINLHSATRISNLSKMSSGAWSLPELQRCWSFQVGCEMENEQLCDVFNFLCITIDWKWAQIDRVNEVSYIWIGM